MCFCCDGIATGGTLLFEAGAVVGAYPVDLESVLVFGELVEIAGGEGLGDTVFPGGIHEGDAGTLEAGTGETTAIDSRQGAHDVVDGDEFRAAALVVVDAGLATVEAKPSEEFQIARFPGSDTLSHAAVFRIEMLGAAGEALRHGDACLLEGGLGNVAQEGLVEGFQRLVGVGQYVPGRRLALIDAEIVIAVDQRTGESAEEDANLEGWHVGIAADDAVVVGVAVEEEQPVFLPEGNAGLVEDAVVEADVFALGLGGNLDDLHGFQRDIVGLGEGHHVCNEHGCRRGESAHGERPLDDALDAMLEFEAFAQRILGSPGIVAPVVFANLRGAGDVKLNISLERTG